MTARSVADIRHVVIGARGALGGAVLTALSDRYGPGTVMGLARSAPADRAGDSNAASSLIADIPLDLTDEDSIAVAADQFASDQLHSVFIASGVLHGRHGGDGSATDFAPEKASRQMDMQVMQHVMIVNAIGPALVGKYFLPKCARKQTVRFAAIGARVGSISDNRLGGWYSYRASKAALHMTIRTLSIEWQRRIPQLICVAMHPGTVDSTLSAPFQGGVPDGKLFSPQQSAGYMDAVLHRLEPEDSGRVYAWDGSEITP